MARLSLDGTAMVAIFEDGWLYLVGEDRPGTVLDVLINRPSTAGCERLPGSGARLLCPLRPPPSFRDFMIFEEHVVNARIGTGQAVPPSYYEAPAFYFTNPACLYGPDEDVPRPLATSKMDFELEVAAVVAADAINVDPDDPATLALIAGFTLMNDWSARDLQMKESPIGLGPVKGKDFATSLGPWVVTPDELLRDGNGRFNEELRISVDGRRVGGGNLADAYFTWGEVLARAAENTRLQAGDLIGSGTVGTGCLLELRASGDRSEYPWLQPGNVVRLEGSRLGVLTNRIVAPEG